jgi:xylulokinase
MDFVTARLTGNITATQHSMFMSQLCDNRTLSVTDYDDELVRLSGVDTQRLPTLVDSDAAVGTLTADMAAQLGLPAAAVVYAGSNDTAMLGAAAGVSKPGRGGLAIGTTSVLVDSVAGKDTDLDHEILSMPALSAEEYLVFAENGNGGRLVEHMLDELVYPDDLLAAHGATDIFANLDSVLAETAAGAGGVLFLPWLAGSLAPSANPNMRGGFINLSFASRRVDLVRSVTEGVAHNLAWLLPHVEAFTDSAIDELAFVGGAARSPQWCQILADVLDKPIAPAADPDTAVARSVARLALARRGVLDRGEVESGVELDRWVEPNSANHAVYQVHQEQFESAFEALRPISEALTAFHSGAAEQSDQSGSEQPESQGDNQ